MVGPGSALCAPWKPGRVRPDIAWGGGAAQRGNPGGVPRHRRVFSAFAWGQGVLACFFLFFLVFKTLFLGALEP